MSLAPSIRVSPDIVSEPLHIIVGLLVNDGGVGVLDNRPLARLNVMAFLVLKMLAGFEVDRVAKILRVSEDVSSCQELCSGRCLRRLVCLSSRQESPAVVHTLKVSGGE